MTLIIKIINVVCCVYTSDTTRYQSVY